MDICAQTGLDFVIIDTKHGILDKETVEYHICAAQKNGLTAFVRLPDSTPYLLRQYMEMGAMGILVPHIGSGEEARQHRKIFGIPLMEQQAAAEAFTESATTLLTEWIGWTM